MKSKLFYSTIFLLICVIVLTIFYYHRLDFDSKNLSILNATRIINICDPQGIQIDINLSCSLTKIDADHVIFVNYNQMYVLDTCSGKTILLDKPENIKVWRPTGVKWCQKNQLLYVANYTGGDILVLKFADNNKLKLVKRYIHPFFVGPENVAIHKDGELFAVGDHDAHKILMFDKSGLLWSRDIGKAHGVAFSADQKSILVTGLSPARIYEFDLSGRLLRQTGQEGWGQDKYLWPTSIAVNNGETWITDAHAGKISRLNDQLETMQSIGGNGLGLDLFNMPYGIELTHDKLLYVTDTFKGRILKIDPRTSEVLTIYQGREMIVDIDQLECILTVKSSATLIGEKPQGATYDKRINLASSIHIDFDQTPIPRVWQCGHNYFLAENNRYLRLSGLTPFVSGSYFYWVNAKNYKYKEKDFTIIGSPQAWTWLIIYKGIMYPISIGSDFYIKDNCIISSRDKNILLDSLCEIASSKIEDYIQSVKKGKLPLQAMSEHLFSTDDFKNRFASAFESVKGKIFLNKLITARSIQKSYEVAKEYLENIRNDEILYFCEIAIASTILESIPDFIIKDIQVDLAYRTTIKNSTPTYPGHDFNTVLKTSDNYAAAIENQQFPQFVHFEFNEASTVEAIKILWESADNYGTNYDFEFYRNNKKVKTVTVDQLKGQTHSIALPKSIITDSIILRVASTSGQQRILMRQVKFMGKK